jgi:quercetin dioxygenase-like cupin family protein
MPDKGLTDLQKLQMLTERLHTLPEISTRLPNGTIDILSAEGKCRLECLYHEAGKTSVILATAEAGSIITSHNHEETEHIIVVSGQMIAYYHDQISVLHPGDSIKFLPGIPHRAEFPVLTIMIGVTVPDTEDYPHGFRPA